MKVVKRGIIRRLPNGLIYIEGWTFDFMERPIDFGRIYRWSHRLMRRIESQQARGIQCPGSDP